VVLAAISLALGAAYGPPPLAALGELAGHATSPPGRPAQWWRVARINFYSHRRQGWTRATGRDMVESLEAMRAKRRGESCWERGRTSPESATLIDLVP